jgi:NAD(P)-dependent dehydrogenase (short-subunit alcohol dehydrogenase family)
MKYILVTGASTGIGHEAVRYLLGKSFFVFGSVRKQEDAQRLLQEFGHEHFMPLVFDVTDEAAIGIALEKVKRQVGSNGLFALVNNAGMALGGPLKHLGVAEVRQQFEVNVFGALAVTKACLPLLGADENSAFPPGRIVNISSVSSLTAFPMLAPYSASKAALDSLNDGLRRELMLYGIKVVSLQPGPIRTPIWEKGAGSPSFSDTDYALPMQQMAKFVRRSEEDGLDAEAVAKAIHHALVAPNPRLRYVITRYRLRQWLLGIIPDTLIDKMLAKMLRLSKRK